MPYQYKREPLSDDEVNRITNACEVSEGVVFRTFLDVTPLGSTSVTTCHLGRF